MPTLSHILQQWYNQQPEKIIITMQQGGQTDLPLSYRGLLRGAAGAAPMRSRRRSGSGTTQTHLSPRFSPDLVTKAPSVRQIGPHVATSDET